MLNRIRFLAVAALLTFIICAPVTTYAGGPAFVAGSGYAPGVEGQPLTWASGSVQYFTDQGNVSPILSGAQADAFVATAFSTWTSIPGISLTASQAGHLAEDVNGSNIATDGYGTVTAPADILSSATSTPIGIVYDYDGTVTDALLGEGAGSAADCFTNAVYGGPDNFSAAGNIAHALVVINGLCATANQQLPDVQYRLVRTLGHILGLGWSQANLNVQTQKPPPTSADFAGFPVMHFTDSISCVPVSRCYPNPPVPKMDDMNALARLYPPSGTSQSTGRIYGTVYFTDANGIALQPMQGVNVVARLLVSGMPSRQYVVSSVSGFAFAGNAGNIVDGYVDTNGLPYSRWGSNDPSLEGFFDLGQLMIPVGQTIAEYQLSVEPLDPYWSLGVEPYSPTQVMPSGAFAPVVVTIQGGSNSERDILMLQDELAQTHPGSGSTYTTPVALPQDGAWGSWISGYGSTDFFQFTAQANRTASVSVIALDETGNPTETKLLPVIGIWQLSDQSGNPAPASIASAFNTPTWGLSRLDAQFGATDTYRLAVADFRGDGRPDYFYQATLLYSDTVTPSRVSLAGGVTTLRGTGFNPALQVSVSGANIFTLSASASQILVDVPAASIDGPATIQVTDPATGGFSQMIGALSYGALSTDTLRLLQSAEPSTPVGSAAANPIRVRALAADGITPVSGATLAWSATNGLQFSICGGNSACSVLSDASGESSSWVTPVATGQSTVTISLAPESYQPPQSQLATVVSTESASDLAAVMPTRWIAQGATVVVPLTVEALNLGLPQSNVTINFAVTNGAASLSASSATTNASGFASITATVTNQNASVQVRACVAPNNSPCQIFTMFSTAPSLWTLETVSGSSQAVSTGQSFQPLVVRVTDGSSASNPVLGVPVTFVTTLARVSTGQGGQGGESLGGGNPIPVILGASQTQVASDLNGLASIVPSAQNVGPCDVFVAVTAAASSTQFQLENLAAIVVAAPKKGNLQAPGKNLSLNFASPTPTTPIMPAMFFALPDGIPSTGSDSTSTSHDPSDAQAGSSSNDAETTNSVFPIQAKPDPNQPKPPKKVLPKKALPNKALPNKVQRTETVTGSASPNLTPPRVVQIKSSSTPSLPADKRSCRALAVDGPLF